MNLMDNEQKITQALTGLVWSVKKLINLMPNISEWDEDADLIRKHFDFATDVLKSVEMRRFPYTAQMRDSFDTFIPTMIDFDNRMVYQQIGQASDSGEWISFDEISLIPNPMFSIK